MTSFLIMVACSVFTAVLAAELVIHRMPSVLKGLTMTETSSQGPRGLTGDKGAKGDTGAPGNFSQRLVIVLIACALVVISIGSSAWLNDRSREKHDKQVEVCTQLWADDYKATADKRVKKAQVLDDATAVWSDQVGTIFDLFLSFVTRAPDSGDEAEDLAALLQVFTDFAAYDKDRKSAQAEVNDSRIKDPYPTLDLQCEEGRQ